jgi:uncharacterized membrane protein YqjE
VPDADQVMVDGSRRRRLALASGVLVLGILVCLAVGWRVAAGVAALPLAACLVQLSRPRLDPTAASASAFGACYLAFGALLLVGGLVTAIKGDPPDRPIAMAMVVLGAVLTPTACLFLWKVPRQRDETHSP